MRVLFAGAELTPIAKVGGLADVMAALPAALKTVGVEIGIVIPRYSFINATRLKCLASKVPVALAQSIEYVSLYRATLTASGVPVFLVEHDRYLSSGSGPYFNSTAFASALAELQRFVFFSKAISALLEQGAFGTVDVVHCNDWHTGALVSLLKSGKKKPASKSPKVVFTIHNLANQGTWKASEIDRWMLARGETSAFVKIGTDYNFMAEGIRNADWVTTVSERYAEEILTPHYGGKLHTLLRQRTNRLTGILNGIDFSFFDPAHDQLIPSRFSVREVEGKQLNKLWLQHHFGFRVTSDIPLFGLVSRLTQQKGTDLIPAAIRPLLRRGRAQFVFLGAGSPQHELALTRLASEFPESVFTSVGFDEQLAHRIYAGSDFFLMPSRFEPSGLGQMIAMRYGSVPVVRATGGLADTVFDKSTGFVFKKETAKDLSIAVSRAIHSYTMAPLSFAAMRVRCMKQKFDFSKSAQEYVKLYRKLL